MVVGRNEPTAGWFEGPNGGAVDVGDEQLLKRSQSSDGIAKRSMRRKRMREAYPPELPERPILVPIWNLRPRMKRPSLLGG